MKSRLINVALMGALLASNPGDGAPVQSKKLVIRSHNTTGNSFTRKVWKLRKSRLKLTKESRKKNRI